MPGRAADAVIGVDLDGAKVDAALAALAERARSRGAALGLVDGPGPVLIARIAAWAGGLGAHDLVLAPVSALALSPAPPQAEKTGSSAP